MYSRLSLVAQWIERPPPKRQVEGSSPFQTRVWYFSIQICVAYLVQKCYIRYSRYCFPSFRFTCWGQMALVVCHGSSPWPELGNCLGDSCLSCQIIVNRGGYGPEIILETQVRFIWPYLVIGSVPSPEVLWLCGWLRLHGEFILYQYLVCLLETALFLWFWVYLQGSSPWLGFGGYRPSSCRISPFFPLGGKLTITLPFKNLAQLWILCEGEQTMPPPEVYKTTGYIYEVYMGVNKQWLLELMRLCRNRQTRQTQNLLVAISYGFESHQPQSELTVHLVVCKVLRKFPQPMQAVLMGRSKVTPSEVA